MDAEIIYRETIGDGDDTEYGRNGIVVTLTYWNTQTFHAFSHYILEASVMIDHKLVVHEHELIYGYSPYHVAEIRKAIARYDQLMELNPECNPNYQATEEVEYGNKQ